MSSLNPPSYCSKLLPLVLLPQVPSLWWQQFCFWLPLHSSRKGSIAEHNVQRSIINSLPLGLWSTYPRVWTPAPPISDALTESWGEDLYNSYTHGYI